MNELVIDHNFYVERYDSNEPKESAASKQKMGLRDKAKQKVEQAAAVVSRRVFKIDQKESAKDMVVRHSFMK